MFEAESSPEKKENTFNWYEGTDGNQKFFTPSGRSSSKPMFHGNGERMPTPREICEFLEKNPEADYQQASGFFIEWDHENKISEPVYLPANAYYYEPDTPNLPERLIPFTMRSDGYIKVDGLFNSMRDDIASFIENEETYRDMKIQYRRGILLYGPPGNGKTSMLRELIRESNFGEDAVSMFMDRLPSKSFLDAMRNTLKDRMKVIVFEELASVLEHTRMEKVLDFLDGERSLDRCMVFGTTNYPERLPGNIVDRPSRFDRLYEMPDPDMKMREEFLKYFMGGDYVFHVEHAEKTKGLSVVALRELALMARNRKYTVTEAIDALQAHKKVVKKAFAKEQQTLGIHARAFEDDYYRRNY